jgi:hypothetical protein
MATNVGGRRLVVGLYVGIVCFTGVAGYLAAGVVSEIESPRLLFLIPLPATRLGLAAYGAITIALMLGVLLIAVTVVADRIDDVERDTIETQTTPNERTESAADDGKQTESTAESNDDGTN